VHVLEQRFHEQPEVVSGDSVLVDVRMQDPIKRKGREDGVPENVSSIHVSRVYSITYFVPWTKTSRRRARLPSGAQVKGRLKVTRLNWVSSTKTSWYAL